MDSESSQTLEVTKNRINEIKRFSSLGITPNEKQNCLRELEKYSLDLEKLEKNEETHTKIVELKKIILEIKQKLSAPNSKNDSSHDFTHLFSLNFSSQNKKIKSRLKQIKSELYDLTKSLFNGKIVNQETVQEILNNYSKELNKFKNKSNQTKIEEIQNIIDFAKGFLFQRREKQQQTKNSDSQLRKLQNIQRASHNKASLDDIAILLQFINDDIKTNELNKDKKSINYLTKSVEILTRGLRMETEETETESEEKKCILERELKRSYQSVAKLKNKRKLEELENISRIMKNISTKLNHQDFRKELKDKFIRCKNKIDSTEEENEEICSKKTRISEYIKGLEDIFANLEKIIEAERKYNELNETNEKSQELSTLKEFVHTISGVNQKIDQMKMNLIEKIDNDLKILAHNMEDNDIEKEEVIDDSILKEVMECSEKLEKLLNNCDSDQNKKILDQLNKIKIKIKMKNELKEIDLDFLKMDIENLKEIFEISIVTEDSQDIERDKEITSTDEDFEGKIIKFKELALIFKELIENALNKYSIKTNETIEDAEATKEQFETDSKLQKIKEDLSNVQKRLEVPDPDADELDRLETRLELIIRDLDNIKSDPLTQEQRQFYKDIHLYFDQVNNIKIIIKFEEEFERVKPEILGFVGLETDEKNSELDETMMQIILALDNLKLDKSSDLQRRKVHLIRQIQEYCDILDERVKQTEEIEDMEEQIDDILMKIDYFNYYKDGDYNDLKKQIVNLNIKLDEMTTNQQLSSRMENCRKKLKEADEMTSGNFS